MCLDARQELLWRGRARCKWPCVDQVCRLKCYFPFLYFEAVGLYYYVLLLTESFISQINFCYMGRNVWNRDSFSSPSDPSDWYWQTLTSKYAVNLVLVILTTYYLACVAYVPTVPILEGQSLFHKQCPSKMLSLQQRLKQGHKFYCKSLLLTQNHGFCPYFLLQQYVCV